ncbi:hypothetical protein PUN28_004768 [Cardiocondyla obscurior]|uniref:Uncharacterized protein n=1 Tax=Cardiocondyla obscurior TaxID=286306 RepID=A0AAW2GEA9_9HYME
MNQPRRRRRVYTDDVSAMTSRRARHFLILLALPRTLSHVRGRSPSTSEQTQSSSSTPDHPRLCHCSCVVCSTSLKIIKYKIIKERFFLSDVAIERIKFLYICVLRRPYGARLVRRQRNPPSTPTTAADRARPSMTEDVRPSTAVIV